MLGLGALVVAKIWLPQGGHPTHEVGAPQGPADGVPVVVAAADIPYGAKLDASRLTVERLPAAAAPRGAFSDPSQILKQAGGPPIALTPIVAHEPVLPGKLSGPGARATVAAFISEGMRAYTIGVSEVAGGGGHILPGDRVDVVLTHDPSNAAAGSDAHHMVSDVVLQDLRVLGMDLNADPTSTQAAAAHTATLEVNVQDAEKLALAGQAGSLSLALRRTGNAEVSPVRTVAVGDLNSAGGHAAGARTPGGARLFQASLRRGPRAPRPATPPRRTVIVVHGDASSSVSVPAERFGAGA
jgi:pilus assembly protein CpaB